MTNDETPGDARFDEAWLSHRTYLIGLAFGMLGDIGAAEDAVQEAFSRLANTEFDRIEDERGWLTVVTSRICLDQIRSAPARHEQVRETATIESAGRAAFQAPSIDPADRHPGRPGPLGAARRAAAVDAGRTGGIRHARHLPDPSTAISDAIGRPAPTCRQLARRAREKIEQEHPHGRTAVGSAQHRLVAEKFIDACASGDLQSLIRTLDPEVSGVIDLGPSDPRTGRVSRGAPVVAANAFRYLARSTLVVSPVGDDPSCWPSRVDGCGRYS